MSLSMYIYLCCMSSAAAFLGSEMAFWILFHVKRACFILDLAGTTAVQEAKSHAVRGTGMNLRSFVS